jgi:hypothetical protein
MSKEPTYDGGKYCVEHLEEGRWKKTKTGKFLSRNWNHITLSYAVYQYEQKTLVGEAARIVYEPTNRIVVDNSNIHTTAAWRDWKYETLGKQLDRIRSSEKERI